MSLFQNVACRQLGFLRHDLLFDEEGSGRIWMDDLDCTGTEASLDQCLFNGFGRNDCDHDEDVGLSCTNDASDFAIRLADGDESSGRLEVRNNGEFGTVCDDSFGILDGVIFLSSCHHFSFELAE